MVAALPQLVLPPAAGPAGGAVSSRSKALTARGDEPPRHLPSLASPPAPPAVELLRVRRPPPRCLLPAEALAPRLPGCASPLRRRGQQGTDDVTTSLRSPGSSCSPVSRRRFRSPDCGKRRGGGLHQGRGVDADAGAREVRSPDGSAGVSVVLRARRFARQARARGQEPTSSQKLVQRLQGIVREDLKACRRPSDVDRRASLAVEVIRSQFAVASTANPGGPIAVAALVEKHFSLFSRWLNEEAERRRRALVAEGRGACRLARSVSRRAARLGEEVGEEEGPATPQHRGAAVRPSQVQTALLVGVFMKFREDGDLHRDCLARTLEQLGFLKPNHVWVSEACNKVTTFSTLSLEEFAAFVKAYEERQHDGHKELFSRLDKDGSGVVDRSEFEVALMNLGIEPLRHIWDEVLAEVGRDGSKAIGFDAFEEALAILHSRQGFTKFETDLLDEVFQRFDVEDCGYITAKDLPTLLAWLGFEVSGEEIARLTAEVDVNASGRIDQRMFLMFMRMIREQELERLKALIASQDVDASGRLQRAELSGVLRALGYEPDEGAVAEAVLAVSSGPGGGGDVERGLDLSGLHQVLGVYRSREGFRAKELEEVEEAFARYDAAKHEEVGYLEVGRILRFLGYSVPLETQMELIGKVDVIRAGTLDIGEMRKLIRMWHTRRLASAREAFTNQLRGADDCISVPAAQHLLDKLGCQESNGDPPKVQELELVMRNSVVVVDAVGFVRAAVRLWNEERRMLRENHGFTLEQVEQMRCMFAEFDEDRSGEIAKGELAALLDHVFPSFARDQATRPKLVGILAEVDADGNNALDFDEFLVLLQRVQEVVDMEKMKKEHRAISETSFTRDEVKAFRDTFLSWAQRGTFHLDMPDLVKLLSKAYDLKVSHLDAFEAFIRETTSKDVIKDDTVFDFPEFLSLVGRLANGDLEGFVGKIALTASAT